jgi:predicted RNase H-like HicB family nuclease
MARKFTLEYWLDDDWYVGRLKEVPGVFSQGETLGELEENIREAYQLMIADAKIATRKGARTKKLAVEV